MLRPSPNHGTLRLSNDDDDKSLALVWNVVKSYHMLDMLKEHCPTKLLSNVTSRNERLVSLGERRLDTSETIYIGFCWAQIQLPVYHGIAYRHNFDCPVAVFCTQLVLFRSF